MATDTKSKHVTSARARVDYWKSLLRIEATVAVTLASKELPVERILNLVPGMMLQFDKACDTPLTVEVDRQKIAEGEVVKVGDKFGLRITEVLEHEERWIPLIQTRGASEARKSQPEA